ncbi:hypothetical protein BGW41_003077 [Actinomortierella wolfii]|nr:hypothetical protein BGW41_003077 [Actinomortierella wolfii]
MSTVIGGIHVPRVVPQYLPLVDIKTRATILATIFRTKLTQTFVNSMGESLEEVRYVFPIYEGVSVVAFICRIGDRTIIGEVKEREKAKNDFKEAVIAGKQAALLEQVAEASDCFITSVSNIPAGAKVEVDITYIGELRHDAEVDGTRFTIPARVLPRYGAFQVICAPHPKHTIDGMMDIVVDVVLPERSTVQIIQSPSHPIAVTLGTISLAPNAEPTMSKASAKLGLDNIGLDKDFVLQVVTKDNGAPTAVLETHPTIPNHRALMTTLVPRFALPADDPEIVFLVDCSGSMNGVPMNLARSALRVFLKSIPVGIKFNICSFGSRYQFLWPKSQSYNSDTLDEALLCVEGMTANFGGTEMYAPLKATIENRYRDIPLDILLLTDGAVWRQEELFEYLNKQVKQATMPLRVFTLGVGNGVSHALIEGIARAGHGFAQAVSEGEKMESKLIRMLRGAMSPHVSDYTLEVKYAPEATKHFDRMRNDRLEYRIDDDDDSDDGYELIERVQDCLRIDTRVKGKQAVPRDGLSIQIPITLYDPNLDVDTASIRSSESSRSAAELPPVKPPKLLQTPQIIPPLFAFNRTTVYLLMGPESNQRTPVSVILRAMSRHGPLELEIPVQVLEGRGELVHQLATRKAVSELEQGRGWLRSAQDQTTKELLHLKYESRFQEMVEREAVRLGLLFNIAGKWTSFVAVEKSPEEIAAAEKEKDLMAKKREQEEEEDTTMATSKKQRFREDPKLDSKKTENKGAGGKRENRSTGSDAPPDYHEQETPVSPAPDRGQPSLMSLEPDSAEPSANTPQSPTPSKHNRRVRLWTDRPPSNDVQRDTQDGLQNSMGRSITTELVMAPEDIQQGDKQKDEQWEEGQLSILEAKLSQMRTQAEGIQQELQIQTGTFMQTSTVGASGFQAKAKAPLLTNLKVSISSFGHNLRNFRGDKTTRAYPATPGMFSPQDNAMSGDGPLSPPIRSVTCDSVINAPIHLISTPSSTPTNAPAPAITAYPPMHRLISPAFSPAPTLAPRKGTTVYRAKQNIVIWGSKPTLQSSSQASLTRHSIVLGDSKPTLESSSVRSPRPGCVLSSESWVEAESLSPSTPLGMLNDYRSSSSKETLENDRKMYVGRAKRNAMRPRMLRFKGSDNIAHQSDVDSIPIHGSPHAGAPNNFKPTIQKAEDWSRDTLYRNSCRPFSSQTLTSSATSDILPNKTTTSLSVASEASPTTPSQQFDAFDLFEDLVEAPLPPYQIPISPFAPEAKTPQRSAKSSLSSSFSLVPPKRAPLSLAMVAVMDPIDALIELQTFAGSWLATMALATTLRVPLAKLHETSRAHGYDVLLRDNGNYSGGSGGGGDSIDSSDSSSDGSSNAEEEHSIFATALAIQYFEIVLKKDKDIWSLLVEKAKTWLRLQLAGDEGKVAEVLAKAADLLSMHITL